MKISVFDSGLGGVLVLKELIKKHPNHEYIYYGDSANIPYGSKSHEFLLETSRKIISFFVKERVDLVIVACGTMSSVVDKSIYSLPIIDVISVVSKYVSNSKYNNIGLIATERTIKEKAFQTSIEKENKTIIARECPNLVNYIEENKLNTLDFENDLQEYLSVFKNENIDSLILGCTHYPLVKDHISKYLDVDLIDMGKVLAETLILDKETDFSLKIYFSRKSDLIVKNVQNILGFDCDIIEKKI